MKTPPSRGTIAGALVSNVLLILAIWGATLWCRYRRSDAVQGIGRVLFLLTLLVPIEAARGVLGAYFPLLRGELIREVGVVTTAALVGSIALVGLTLIMLFRRQVARISAALLFAFAPVIAVTYGNAIAAMVRYDDAKFRDKPTAARLASAPKGPRTVWVVFDEWDYRLTFPDRKRSVRMPEIDRLRGESLFAENAYPPSRDTEESLPGMIVGDHVRAQPVNMERAELSIGGRPPVRWRSVDNVFRRARRAGVNTALMGWGLPYCRILNDDLTDCAWWARPMQRNSLGEQFSEAVVDAPRSLMETSLFSVFGQTLVVQHYIRMYGEMLDQAKGLLADRDLGLVLIHFPTPHAPYPYDAKAGTMTRNNSAIEGYLDNLMLLDRTFGEFRRTLESSGQWDSITLIVSSDHFFRSAKSLDGKADYRVPFMMRFPGQKQGSVIKEPFNTVLTGDLVLEAMGGTISKSHEAADWLRAHRKTRSLKWGLDGTSVGE